MHSLPCICVVAVLLFCPNLSRSLHLTHDASILKSTLNFIDGIIHQALELLSHERAAHRGPIDCTDVKKAGNTKSGIYRIWPLNWETYGSFQVFCDMDTNGGGWTVIQRRGDYKQPQDYFYKTWKEYQMGFGKLHEDFWLGNDKIFSLTNQGNYSLRIDMKDKEGEHRYAVYKDFWIENEKHLYTLRLFDFTGNADGIEWSTWKGANYSLPEVDMKIRAQ